MSLAETYVPLETLEVGDRVFLKTDPRKDEGTVKELMHGRFFVRWDNGRTWIYPRSWLVKVEG